MTVIDHDAETGEPIYAAAPGFLCPRCGDILTTMPDGRALCPWCDILVADAPKATSDSARLG